MRGYGVVVVRWTWSKDEVSCKFLGHVITHVDPAEGKLLVDFWVLDLRIMGEYHA